MPIGALRPAPGAESARKLRRNVPYYESSRQCGQADAAVIDAPSGSPWMQHSEPDNRAERAGGDESNSGGQVSFGGWRSSGGRPRAAANDEDLDGLGRRRVRRERRRVERDTAQQPRQRAPAIRPSAGAANTVGHALQMSITSSACSAAAAAGRPCTQSSSADESRSTSRATTVDRRPAPGWSPTRSAGTTARPERRRPSRTSEPPR
jgi:hypothetical protein